MATQEVIKHTKKVYKIWNSKEHSFAHKLKEFVIEILIIVFAVSLSIWLHELSEHKEKKHIAREFLIGLKADLQKDVSDLESMHNSYKEQEKAFACFIKAAQLKQDLPVDSIQKYNSWVFFSFTTFTARVSRFEGLKSAGQLSYIENSVLLNDILNLYQNQLPWIDHITDTYIKFKQEKLYDYYDNHLPEGENYAEQVSKLIRQPVMQRYLRRGSLLKQILEETRKTKELSNLIIKHIETYLQKES